MEELLFGRRYRAIEKIGSGGMADVYKAIDEVLGRTVAVKVMHARFAADPAFAARFRQEAQAAANLASPNIVNMYDWGLDAPETYYIVMEYVAGSDLESIIASKGALPSHQVARIGEQVCSALSAAHGYDVIHRDIKPQNIMVKPDGTVKVMDFGIARAGNSNLTQTGSVFGTAQYLSPEQAQGRPLTAASDLYSLGVVLYQAATGRPPFDGDTPVAVALKQVNEQPVPPRVVNPDIDPDLDAVILKALQKNTADRYVSADELRRDLRGIAEGRHAGVLGSAGAAYSAVSSGGAPVAGVPRPKETSVMPQVSAVEARADATPPRSRAVAPRSRAVPGPRPGRRSLWPAVVLAMALVAAGLVMAWNVGLLGTQNTPVPDVSAMTRSNAQTALRDAGFVPGTVKQRFSDTVKAGMVASQSPGPYATVRKGATVDLVLSKGPEKVSVPGIVGMLEADAFQALEKAGFRPQALPSEYNADAAVNTVYTQTPAGAAKAVKGAVVNYVVSRGPEPVPVPQWGNGDKPGKAKDGWGRH